METTQNLPCNALTKGYILVPKQLLEELIAHSEKPMSELEAWLTMLVTVNYADGSCQIGERVLNCKRGESVHTLSFWATRFRWTRGKVRSYFQRLQRRQRIRLLPCPYTTHLQIVDYNLWTGCRTEARQCITRKTDEAFDTFWTTYHRIMQMEKVNIGRARREWQKLTSEERLLATQRIEDYYYHLRSVKFCLQAATYLSNKAFLNEYDD